MTGKACRDINLAASVIISAQTLRLTLRWPAIWRKKARRV